jgi:hypothetical protein
VDVVEIEEEEVRLPAAAVRGHLLQRVVEHQVVGRDDHARQRRQEGAVVALQDVEEAAGLDEPPDARFRQRQQDAERVGDAQLGEQARVALEAARGAGDGAVEERVPGHHLGVVAGGGEALGQRRRALRVRHRLEMGAVRRRQQAGEHAEMGGQRPALGGACLPEGDGVARQPVEEGRVRGVGRPPPERTRAQ